MKDAKWIWLNQERYPEYQKTRCTVFGEQKHTRFAIAEFRAEFPLKSRVRNVHADVCGDTKFWLYESGRFIGMGPVCAGGDYDNARPMPKYYMNHYDFAPDGERLSFFARVQLSPEVMTDYSCGRGGFILRCEVEYEDGAKEVFATDKRWQARLNRAYADAMTLDATIQPDEWMDAAEISSVWNLYPTPIPMLEETEVFPDQPMELTAQGHEEACAETEFDRIYSGYVLLEIEADGLAEVTAATWELPGQNNGTAVIRTERPLSYRGLRMASVGGMTVTAKSLSGGSVRVKGVRLMFARYPVTERGRFECSDEGLNKIWEVGCKTLEICRQWIHLDSPKHQETLGCTGDYYIESLMTYFAFGDARLVRMDIVRTTDWLKLSGGFMFHTTYSLIWVRMLRDYFRYTADRSVLFDTADALMILLERFNGYLGENGLIEHAPNYMFIDWREVDGYSMHHPPKALGQTCLNAFYYMALIAAAEICNEMGEHAQAALYVSRARALKAAFDGNFYDAERGLYFDGLNTPGEVNPWQPENTDKRYYSKHSSAMAVYSGLCEGEKARAVMEKVMTDDSLIDVQPYFAHFVLDALHRAGLFEKYGMKMIDRWRETVERCDKGLQEGWHKPGAAYSFDHSHAWGGTPVYQLPCRILGFEMLEPGFRRIRLAPRLMGLKWADIEVPTPFGPIHCRLKAGEKPEMEIPDQIRAEVEL